MKRLLTVFLIVFSYYSCNAQITIGAPKSLILVYNYPNNCFFIEIDGVNKGRTETPGAFIIDNKFIQVLAVNKSKFVNDDMKDLSDKKMLKEYIKWEQNYIEKNYSEKVYSKAEYSKSNKGNDIVFWTYEFKSVSPDIVVTDSTTTEYAQKHLFAFTREKDYIVGIYSPLFERRKFESLKSFLIANIGNVHTSLTEIDADELYKQKLEEQK